MQYKTLVSLIFNIVFCVSCDQPTLDAPIKIKQNILTLGALFVNPSHIFIIILITMPVEK